MNYKEQLADLARTVPVKNISRSVKKRADLLSWVLDNTVEFQDATLSQRIWMMLNHKPDLCEHGNYPVFNSFSKGFRKYCGVGNSCECRRQAHGEIIKQQWDSLSAEEKQARHGNAVHLQDPAVQQRAKATCRERYGADKPFLSSEVRQRARQSYKDKTGYDTPLHDPEVQQKIKSSHLEKYQGLMVPARAALNDKYSGVNPFAVPEIKEKIRETNLARYGAWPSSTSEIQQKIRETSRTKWGVDNHSQAHLTEYQKQILNSRDTFSEFIAGKSVIGAAKYLKVSEGLIARTARQYGCLDLINSYTSSTLETEIEHMLNQHDVRFEKHNRTILGGQELDFWLPDHRTAIEVGSLYWHSEIVGGRHKNYHFNKWEQCHHKGIRLFTWFNDDVHQKTSVIHNKIQYVAGTSKPVVGARKCVLKRATYQQTREILEENHIQGAVKNSQYILGAYHDHQLVGMMGFARRKNYLELTRFVTDTSRTYPGLFSKMLKHSVRDMEYTGDVVSFSDNAHGSGDVYSASGFEVSEILGPSYWYTDDYVTRHNRQQFMKSKIAKRFDISEQQLQDNTEWQLMQLLGYDRIWDTGKIKWVINL